MSATRKRVKWIPVILVGLPVWLVASTLVGLWLWHQGSDEAEEPAKFSTSIEAGSVASDLRKLVDLAGPRHTADDDGRLGLTRAAAMIEGALGPSNAGYRVRTVAAPPVDGKSWPLIVARLPGGGQGEPLWLVTGYDQRPGGGGVEANATGVAALLAAAGEVALVEPRRPVYFAFLPHLYDPRAPVTGTLEDFKRLIDGESEGGSDRGTVVVIESMGGARSLVASSRSSAALAAATADGAAAPVEFAAVAPEGARDVAATLVALELPVVRLATRAAVAADEADEEFPDPEAHAAASRELAAWLRGRIR
jgi:hypothetical protein